MLLHRISAVTIIIVAFFLSGCDKNEVDKPENNSTSHPAWSYNQTIYELNIRQFSEEGTIKKAEEQLPRLKEMGVGIVWLMPVNPIGETNRKGSLGSYYSVKDYKKFNPEFGTEEDFRNFVTRAHQLGLYVIIDWVANHTAWDNVWVKDHPDFYTRDSSGNFMPPVADWSDVIDLNYDNPEVHEYMIDAMTHWVKEFNIDGFRCDVAAMVPLEFWQEAKVKLDSVKNVFMLAEAHEPELHDKAFDMTYNWELKDLINQIAKGEKQVTDIKKHVAKEKADYPADAFRMNFITNHDENSWNGNAYERLNDGVEAFFTLAATLEGMPLVYNGQEAGLNKSLEFFEHDPIEWGKYGLSSFYSKLLNLHLNNKALWNGDKGGEVEFITSSDSTGIIAYSRVMEENKVVVLLNLSADTRESKLTGDNLEGNYTELFTEENVSFNKSETFTLGPWEYRVYYK